MNFESIIPLKKVFPDFDLANYKSACPLGPGFASNYASLLAKRNSHMICFDRDSGRFLNEPDSSVLSRGGDLAFVIFREIGEWFLFYSNDANLGIIYVKSEDFNVELYFSLENAKKDFIREINYRSNERKLYFSKSSIDLWRSLARVSARP